MYEFLECVQSSFSKCNSDEGNEADFQGMWDVREQFPFSCWSAEEM